MNRGLNRFNYEKLLSRLNIISSEGKYELCIYDDDDDYSIIYNDDIKRLLLHDGFKLSDITSDYINDKVELIGLRIEW